MMSAVMNAVFLQVPGFFQKEHQVGSLEQPFLQQFQHSVNS